MKIVINGETVELPSGGGGVTMDQVNEAIDTKLDDYTPQEVYSTEETRIGTWIDGKPVYRRIFTGNLPYSSGWSVVFEVPDMEEPILVNMKIQINQSDLTYSFSDPSTGVGSKGNSISFYTTNAYQGKRYMCIVEYTKTTDQATASVLSNKVVSKNNEDFALNLPQQSVSFSPVTMSNIAEEEE